MQNISTFGAEIRLISSNTHPFGFKIDSFSDDVDPIAFSPVVVREDEMDLNGNLVSWAVGGLIPLSISVIPGSEDDENLYILLNANRASGYAVPKRDDITLTISYPDQSMKVFSKGKILLGSPSSGAAASGRMTTNTYGFAFSSMTNVSARSAIHSVLNQVLTRT